MQPFAVISQCRVCVWVRRDTWVNPWHVAPSALRSTWRCNIFHWWCTVYPPSLHDPAAGVHDAPVEQAHTCVPPGKYPCVRRNPPAAGVVTQCILSPQYASLYPLRHVVSCVHCPETRSVPGTAFVTEHATRKARCRCSGDARHRLAKQPGHRHQHRRHHHRRRRGPPDWL